MMKSIRVQLPLTYAGIALLAALLLGTLMLLRLNDYYSQMERSVMKQSAEGIQQALQTTNLVARPAADLQAQISSFAFFARSRVRLYAAGGALLADSGEFDPQNVIHFATLPSDVVAQGNVVVFQSADSGLAAPLPDSAAIWVSPTFDLTESEPQAMTIYSLSAEQPAFLPVFSGAVATTAASSEEDAGARSSHAVELPLDSQGAKLVVSGGPAFGHQIVTSVAQAWAAAGLVAVALAAAAGWLVSRRITTPLTELARVTACMASGDLSARAAEMSSREFGALGRAFNRMAGQVEATIHSLRRFAADAAHELKTPLTALRTDLELAEGENDPARLAGLLARARAQVSALERLTGGLLDLSRLETGALPLAVEPLDACALARQLSERYAARAEQAGQEFQLDLPSEPVSLNANPARLELALGNLLDNALKFTPAGGTIRLGLEQDAHGVDFIVEDTGAGIPTDDLALIFARFHRGRNAAAYPGSGLGLAIVRAVAEAHSGSVTAANRPGGGAQFRLRLPML